MSTMHQAVISSPRVAPPLAWGWAAAGLLFLAGVGAAAVGAMGVAILLLAGAAGVALWQSPDLATLGAAFILYTNAAVVAVRFHGVPSVAAGAFVLVLAWPLFQQLVVQGKRIIITPAVPFFVLFVAVRLLGILVAKRQEVAVGSVTSTLTEGLVLYLLFTNVIRDARQLQRVVWVIIAAGGLLGALSAYQYACGNFHNNFSGFAQSVYDLPGDLPEEFSGPIRSAGPVGEKNYYGQFMLMLMPLALMQMLRAADWRQRLAAAGCAGLIAAGIALTASRGAAVAFVLLVAVMLVYRQISWRQGLMVAAATAVLLVATPQLRERMASIGSFASLLRGSEVRQVDKSTQGRITEMLAAGLVFSEHPVLGVGPGNFPLHFLEKADALGFQVHAEERLAHCSYLELAAESGLIGLVLYLGILGATVRQLVWARRQATSRESQTLVSSFLLMLLVMVVSSLFLSFAYERYYWFMLALAATAGTVAVPNNTVSETSS